MATRRADFAGSWYPSGESECRRAIDGFVKGALPCPHTQRRPVGGIVPHAGWFYSGKIACSVMKCLATEGEPPQTVVVFGRHLHPGSPNYIMREGSWATPLGDLAVDEELAAQLVSKFRFVAETASRYDPDNTIELQLPLIKYFFPEAKILPIGVPPVRSSLDIGREVGIIAKSKDFKVLVLGSTDLTHYGYNYGFTPKGAGPQAIEWVKNENDRRVVELMTALDANGVLEESLRNHNACCGGAVATAVEAARMLGAREGSKLFYMTSYDIRPDSSFVGYVGIVFS